MQGSVDGLGLLGKAQARSPHAAMASLLPGPGPHPRPACWGLGPRARLMNRRLKPVHGCVPFVMACNGPVSAGFPRGRDSGTAFDPGNRCRWGCLGGAGARKNLHNGRTLFSRFAQLPSSRPLIVICLSASIRSPRCKGDAHTQSHPAVRLRCAARKWVPDLCTSRRRVRQPQLG